MDLHRMIRQQPNLPKPFSANHTLLRGFLFPIVLALMLTGCQGEPTATASLVPTERPSTTPTTGPTFTPPATPEFSPLTEATQPIILEPPVPTETPTPAPPPVHLPDSSITLFQPGPGSQVVSPVRVLGHAGPSYEERVRVRLLNEAGDEINSFTTILFAYSGNAGRFAANIPFEFSQVSELGWLQVDTFDRRYNRLAHRFTREVVLLSAGSPRIFPGYRQAAPLAILQPRENAVVPFGTVAIQGGGSTEGEGELVLQAWDRYGEIIDSQEIELSSGVSGRIGTFEAALEIELPFSQFGRLAVMELDPRTGEPKFLNSIEVYFRRN